MEIMLVTIFELMRPEQVSRPVQFPALETLERQALDVCLDMIRHVLSPVPPRD